MFGALPYYTFAATDHPKRENDMTGSSTLYRTAGICEICCIDDGRAVDTLETHRVRGTSRRFRARRVTMCDECADGFCFRCGLYSSERHDNPTGSDYCPPCDDAVRAILDR